MTSQSNILQLDCNLMVVSGLNLQRIYLPLIDAYHDLYFLRSMLIYSACSSFFQDSATSAPVVRW